MDMFLQAFHEQIQLLMEYLLNTYVHRLFSSKEGIVMFAFLKRFFRALERWIPYNMLIRDSVTLFSFISKSYGFDENHQFFFTILFLFELCETVCIKLIFKRLPVNNSTVSILISIQNRIRSEERSNTGRVAYP